MMKTKNIFAVSFIAMLAVSVANATIVTQENVVGTGGVSVNVPASGQTNAGKVVVDGSAFVQTAGNTANKAVITNSSGNITTGTITSAMITDKTIANADIADSTIAKGKLASGVQASLDLADAAAAGTNKVNGAPLSNAETYFYGTSSTAAATAQKDVSIPSITDFKTGLVIVVVPTVSHSSTTSCSIKLNNFDAKPIWYNGSVANSASKCLATWTANKASVFAYNGTAWIYAGSDTTYSALSVSDGRTGTATNNRVITAANLKAIVQGTDASGENGLAQGAKLGDGYAKASSASAITESDTIREAIGKLEKKVDDAADAAAASASSTHTHNTGEVTALTGYTKGSSTAALATTDSLNDALSKLENQIDKKVTANTAITAKSGKNLVSFDAKGLVTGSTAAGALAVKDTISNADVASNAAIADSKIARTGTITSGNTNIPTGGVVYTAVNAKADKATTLAGYGITDAYTKTQTDTALEAKQDIQIGAAKSGSTASTDSGKAVVVDDDGKIAMSDNKLGSAAYTASSAYATSAQGGKADTALQSVTANNNAGVVTNVAKSGTAITMTKAKVKSADIADDAAIAKTQLASTVQASLDLADAAAAGTNKVNGAPLSNAETYFYGTSSTAAATAQKDVSIPSITELKTGQFIVVKPTVTSTVANSTIKLNSFTAYPMRYNNAAITTSTDSVVWSANILSIFLFDGTYWQFVGHGIDNNSTYSALSGAELTGTGTTGRLITGAQYGAKQDALGYTPENVANKVTSDGYNDYVDSETRYPSMATTDAMIANAKLGLQTDIGKKIDKVVAADKQTVMVRDSGGNYVKGTGNDISVSQTGGITVNHATNATSANSIPSGAENATTYATIWVE